MVQNSLDQGPKVWQGNKITLKYEASKQPCFNTRVYEIVKQGKFNKKKGLVAATSTEIFPLLFK